MCIKAVEVDPWLLKYVPDHFKTQEMCDAVVIEDPLLLRYVPDWFVTQQQVKLRDDYCIDDRLKWHDGYKKRKAQKAQIEEKLTPITWHPSRWWNWCVPEDEKKETEKLWT